MGNIHLDSINQPPPNNYDSIHNYNYKTNKNNIPINNDQLTGNVWTNTKPKIDFLENNMYQIRNQHPLQNQYTRGNENPARYYQQSSSYGQSATFGQTSNQNPVNNHYSSGNYLSTRAKQIEEIQSQEHINRDQPKRNYNPSIYYPQTTQLLATKYRSKNSIPPTEEPEILTPLSRYQPTRSKCTKGPFINDVSSEGEGGGPPSKPIYYISSTFSNLSRQGEGGGS